VVIEDCQVVDWKLHVKNFASLLAPKEVLKLMHMAIGVS
jgi:hypothetical protein